MVGKTVMRGGQWWKLWRFSSRIPEDGVGMAAHPHHQYVRRRLRMVVLVLLTVQ